MLTVTTPTEARFHDLYTRYHQPIQRRIQHVLKPSNVDLAEDVEQMTWLKVWKALPTTPNIGYNWCSMVATNAAIDAIRSRYHLKYTFPLSIDSLDRKNRSGEHIYDVIDTNTPDVVDLASWREEVRSLLSRMTQQERRIFFLFYIGYSAKELDAQFAISEDEAYGAIQRIYDRMRRLRSRMKE